MSVGGVTLGDTVVVNDNLLPLAEIATPAPTVAADPISLSGPTGMTGPVMVTDPTAYTGPTATTSPTLFTGPTDIITPTADARPTTFTGSTATTDSTGMTSYVMVIGPTMPTVLTEPTDPNAPVGPTALTPLTDPTGPTAPTPAVGPIGSMTGPADLTAPTAPAGTAAPPTPTGFTAQDGPAGAAAQPGTVNGNGPTGIAAPTDPIGFTAPTGPTESVAPVEPTGFVDPMADMTDGPSTPGPDTADYQGATDVGATNDPANSDVAASPPAVPALPQAVADAAAGGAGALFPRTTALFPPAGMIATPTDPATPTAPTGPTAPGAQGGFGTYLKHYTGSGSSDNGSFYMDVAISETYGPTATSATPVDQGTVTVTAWLLSYGEYVYNETDVVVPITADDVSGVGVFGFGTRGGDNAALRATADLSVGQESWAHEHWTESIVIGSGGAFTGADGAAYVFSNLSVQSETRDVTRTFAPGDELVPEPATETTTYDGTLLTDNATSNLVANLPSGAGLDADGYPNDLSTAPADGTTYLVRSFNSQSWRGTDSTTNPYAGNATTNYTRDSSYSGVDAYRDYEDFSSQSGSAGDASTDHLTRQVNYERKESYGGGESYDLTPAGVFSTYSGSRSDDRQDTGQVLVNTSDVKDAYYRDNGTLGADGVYEVKTSDDGQPSTYSDSETALRDFDSHGDATTDTLSYDHERSGDVATTVSNSYYYVAADRNDGGLLVGTTGGTSLDSAASDRHTETSDSGVRDLLAGGGWVNVSGSYSGSDSSVKSWDAAYVGTDGATPWSTFSLAWSTDAVSGGNARQGDVNAAGSQTDGVSTSHTESVGDSGGLGHSVKSGPAMATQTTDVTASGDSITGSSSDRTYHSDGTADGTVTDDADSTSHLESTVTAAGTYETPGGTASANDRDHRKTRTHHHTAVDLTVSSDVPSGTITSEDRVLTTYDYFQHHTIDLSDGSLHAILDVGSSSDPVGSSGEGWLQTTDTVEDAVCGSELTGTRTFDFRQMDNSGSKLSASGTLSDANGHTGSWTLTQISSSKTGVPYRFAGPSGCELNITSEWQNYGWVETGRTFSTVDWKEATSRYHEEDDGLGQPAAADASTGMEDARTHSLDVTTRSESLTVRDGTPTDYTFETDNEQGKTTKESTGRTWFDGQGDGGSYTVKTEERHSLIDDQSGSVAQGQVVQDRVHQNKDDYSANDQDGMNYSPRVYNETHSRDHVGLMDSRQGDIGPHGSGSGHRDFFADYRSWWQSDDRTAWFNGWTSGGNPDAPVYQHEESLDWGGPVTYAGLALTEALWQDLANSQEGQWIGAHWGDVLRVAGGSVDFLFGFGMSLGSGGLAILPGVGLMAVGIDQIYAGEAGVILGERGPSVLEFVGASAASAAGADPRTAQMIGTWTPAALSLVFTLGGSLLQAPTQEAQAAAAAAMEEQEIIREMQASVDEALARADAAGGAPGPQNSGVPWEYGTPGGPGARNAVPWQYGNLGPGVLGSTDELGNITIRNGLTGRLLDETVAHESVHRFFSPLSGPFRNFRANIGIWGYENSHLIRYLEEALAEGYATGSVWEGLVHPLSGYRISVPRLFLEAGGYTAIVGGGPYLGYRIVSGWNP